MEFALFSLLTFLCKIWFYGLNTFFLYISFYFYGGFLYFIRMSSSLLFCVLPPLWAQLSSLLTLFGLFIIFSSILAYFPQSRSPDYVSSWVFFDFFSWFCRHSTYWLSIYGVWPPETSITHLLFWPLAGSLQFLILLLPHAKSRKGLKIQLIFRYWWDELEDHELWILAHFYWKNVIR